MSLTTTASWLTARYPAACIVGRRTTRDEAIFLDWSMLDAATASDLGREQIGWFVGGHPGLERTVQQLARLEAAEGGGIWIAVPSMKDLSTELWLRWPHQAQAPAPLRGTSRGWRSRRIWFATPELLAGILPEAREHPDGVAGVILIDPPCIMHLARGPYNDRPQHVVNFRAGLALGDWQPPLILLTTKPAMAVSPIEAARAYCLSTWWFIASSSFDCCPAHEDA